MTAGKRARPPAIEVAAIDRNRVAKAPFVPKAAFALSLASQINYFMEVRSAKVLNFDE